MKISKKKKALAVANLVSGAYIMANVYFHFGWKLCLALIIPFNVILGTSIATMLATGTKDD